MAFPIVSYKTIKQSDSAVVIAAGPSASLLLNRVLEWKNDLNALVFGAHYYSLKPDYTVFEVPGKFIRAQGKIPGEYIIGPRIQDRIINRRYRGRIIRMTYTKKKFLEFGEEDSFDFTSSVPQDGAGVQSMFISLFSRPKNLLFVGFDGFVYKNNALVLEHAKFNKNVNPRHFKDVIEKRRVKKYLDGEEIRRKVLYRFFDFITNKKNINLHIFNDDKFRGLDKTKLRDMGVKIL